ncbi:MAG: flagellar basal body P-ring protein FlgI [Rhodothermaceae bacterium]
MKKILIISLILCNVLLAQRIKDISYFKGVQSEELIGYGIVTGLAGTGDSHRTSFTIQSIISMMKRFGINAPELNLRTRNVAAVIITARVNNLLKPGAEFDIIVSSTGDATSLVGGTLLMSPLKDGYDNFIGVAQGPVSVGGYNLNTRSGGRLAKNHATTGRVPGGGIVRNEIARASMPADTISIFLKEPDFTTSNNVATAINGQIGANTAIAIDATEIKVTVPQQNQNNVMAFIAGVEAIQVQQDVQARVVVNERTGTIVAGQNVRILPVTISHGNLNISIRSYPIISQPNSFSQGQTRVFNNLIPTTEEEKKPAVTINGATTVQEVAQALNSLNISPRDIISVFQALKQAGALTGNLVII